MYVYSRPHTVAHISDIRYPLSAQQYSKYQGLFGCVGTNTTTLLCCHNLQMAVKLQREGRPSPFYLGLQLLLSAQACLQQQEVFTTRNAST